MNTVSFSSWNGKIVDNRKGSGVAKAADINFPDKLNGNNIKALMGWNGLIISDPQTDVPSLAFGYLKNIRKLSCGECSVCMIGIDRILDLFKNMNAGKGSQDDLDLIAEIAKGVAENSKCNFGGSSLAPVIDAVEASREAFVEVIEGKKKLSDKAYEVSVSAPCMHACPARLDIPGYIERIRNFKFKDSLNLIRERCILPGVIGRTCPAPCEKACVRVDMDEPLAIRLLKRAAADSDLKEGASALSRPVSEKAEKIAIIGAGPAGLAAAYHLRLMGYQVTIFESLPHAGGMAIAGIPDYRLPKDILGHEADLIKRMGIEIKYNTKVGKLDIKDLQKQGYKAFFLAVGAQNGTKIGCKGEDAGYTGYVDGVEFLREFSLGKKVDAKKKVVIIGGGNVALDCARSCARLGFEDVEILYRRSRAEMPASNTEIREAQEEGIKFNYLKAPVKILAKDGKVTGLEYIKMKLGEPDGSGRRRPIPIKGSEARMKADMVIAATGQKSDLALISGKDGVETTDWGSIKADPVTFKTSVEGIFAGGDCVSGPATLIEALNAGNKVARSIDCTLQGKPFADPDPFAGVETGAQRDAGLVVRKAAAKADFLEVARRLEDASEVEGGFSTAEARAEATRCLRCYRLMVWE